MCFRFWCRVMPRGPTLAWSLTHLGKSRKFPTSLLSPWFFLRRRFLVKLFPLQSFDTVIMSRYRALMKNWWVVLLKKDCASWRASSKCGEGTFQLVDILFCCDVIWRTRAGPQLCFSSSVALLLQVLGWSTTNLRHHSCSYWWCILVYYSTCKRSRCCLGSQGKLLQERRLIILGVMILMHEVFLL